MVYLNWLKFTGDGDPCPYGLVGEPPKCYGKSQLSKFVQFIGFSVVLLPCV